MGAAKLDGRENGEIDARQEEYEHGSEKVSTMNEAGFYIGMRFHQHPYPLLVRVGSSLIMCEAMITA